MRHKVDGNLGVNVLAQFFRQQRSTLLCHNLAQSLVEGLVVLFIAKAPFFVHFGQAALQGFVNDIRLDFEIQGLGNTRVRALSAAAAALFRVARGRNCPFL